MKHLLFASIIFIIACGGPSTPMTIDQIAEANNASVGSYQKVYRSDKKYKHEDGRYMMLNIQSIKKHPAFRTSDGEEHLNVVVIENIGTIEDTQSLLDKAAYFILFDENGNEMNDIQMSTQTGAALNEIILLTDNDINKYKYLLVGNIDSSTNENKASIVFELK